MKSIKSVELADCTLSNYPLSRGFSERLSARIGTSLTPISIAELRRLSLFGMFKAMRAHRVNRLFLPIESESSVAILPILKLLACIIPAREIFVITTELNPVRFKKRQGFSAYLGLVKASISSFFAVKRSKREVARLLNEDRIVVNSSNKRILYINANLWFGVQAGGSVGHISGVINALSEVHAPVHYASTGGRLLVKEKYPFTQLTPPAYFGLPWEYNYYRFHFSVVEQLKKLAQVNEFGCIYQRLSHVNYSGLLISRFLKIPLIVEYNDSAAGIAPHWGKPMLEQALVMEIENVNLRHAHLVVAISDVLRDELLERQIPAERIVSYPNGIDPEMFNPSRFMAADLAQLRQRHGIAPDALVVTFIGTFGHWHGIEVLAQAIRTTLDQHQDWLRHSKLHFLLVGDGVKMPHVREILGADANGPFVTLAGLVPQHEAPLYLAASDILSSPHVPNADGSRFFGSPTKLFEYMAMGKPIIASNLDQIGDVLIEASDCNQLAQENLAPKAKATAIFCEPGKAEDIITSLRLLVDHPAWKEQLGTNARELALSKYTWRHNVEAVLAQARALKLLQ